MQSSQILRPFADGQPLASHPINAPKLKISADEMPTKPMAPLVLEFAYEQLTLRAEIMSSTGWFRLISEASHLAIDALPAKG